MSDLLDLIMHRARGPIRGFEDLLPEERRAAVLLDDGISVGQWSDAEIEALQWHRFARAEKLRRERLEA